MNGDEAYEVSSREARRLLESIIKSKSSPKTDEVELTGIEEGVVMRLYKSVMRHGKIMHRYESVIEGMPCIICQNGRTHARPNRAVILLHGFASSPLIALNLIERYYNLLYEEREPQPRRDSRRGTPSARVNGPAGVHRSGTISHDKRNRRSEEHRVSEEVIDLRAFQDEDRQGGGTVWVIPRGPIQVIKNYDDDDDVVEFKRINEPFTSGGGTAPNREDESSRSRRRSTGFGMTPLADLGLLCDSSLYCWWELNYSLKICSTFHHLLRMIKNKLFNPVNVEDIIVRINKIISRLAPGVDHVYLAGFCQGATLASEIIHHNEQLSGAILLSGGPCKTSAAVSPPGTSTPQANTAPVRPLVTLGGRPLATLAARPLATLGVRPLATLPARPLSRPLAALPARVTLPARPLAAPVHALPLSETPPSHCGWATEPPAAPPDLAADARAPLFISHGFEDTVVPYALGKLLRRKMLSRGYSDIQFSSFKGGHEIPDEIIYKLISWFSHNKNSSRTCKKGAGMSSPPAEAERSPHGEGAARLPLPCERLRQRSENELACRLSTLVKEFCQKVDAGDRVVVLPASNVSTSEPDELELMRHVTGYEQVEAFMVNVNLDEVICSFLQRVDYFNSSAPVAESTAESLRKKFGRMLFFKSHRVESCMPTRAPKSGDLSTACNSQPDISVSIKK